MIDHHIKRMELVEVERILKHQLDSLIDQLALDDKTKQSILNDYGYLNLTNPKSIELRAQKIAKLKKLLFRLNHIRHEKKQLEQKLLENAATVIP